MADLTVSAILYVGIFIFAWKGNLIIWDISNFINK